MANEARSDDHGADALEEPLLGVDPDLNIFALANGLDLFRNHTGPADRVLEWYREGMERRIVIRAEQEGRISLHVEAARRMDGVEHLATRPLAEVDAGELGATLRDLLADGVERANELERTDLAPPG